MVMCFAPIIVPISACPFFRYVGIVCFSLLLTRLFSTSQTLLYPYSDRSRIIPSNNPIKCELKRMIHIFWSPGPTIIFRRNWCVCERASYTVKRLSVIVYQWPKGEHIVVQFSQGKWWSVIVRYCYWILPSNVAWTDMLKLRSYPLYCHSYLECHPKQWFPLSSVGDN